jgi:hypothetical protein
LCAFRLLILLIEQRSNWIKTYLGTLNFLPRACNPHVYTEVEFAQKHQRNTKSVTH